jgi:hypothetical protein
LMPKVRFLRTDYFLSAGALAAYLQPATPGRLRRIVTGQQ